MFAPPSRIGIGTAQYKTPSSPTPTESKEGSAAQAADFDAREKKLAQREAIAANKTARANLLSKELQILACWRAWFPQLLRYVLNFQGRLTLSYLVARSLPLTWWSSPKP
eukprot:8966273-Pyramimonas_sp.AAC.4